MASAAVISSLLILHFVHGSACMCMWCMRGILTVTQPKLLVANVNARPLWIGLLIFVFPSAAIAHFHSTVIGSIGV